MPSGTRGAATIDKIAADPLDEIQMAERVRPERMLTNNGSTYVLQGKTVTYAQSRDIAVASLQTSFTDAQCDTACIKAQLDDYHCRQCGIDPGTRIKAVFEGAQGIDKATESKLLDQFNKLHGTTESSAK